MLVFEERGKPEYQEKNLSEQGRDRTNNKLNPQMSGVDTRIWTLGHIKWEASALTTMPTLCFF